MVGKNSPPKLNIQAISQNSLKVLTTTKIKALGLLKNKDGEFSDNPEESSNTLLNKFFPGHTSVPETDSMDWSIIKNSRLDNTFTIKKVRAAFCHMGSFKSADPDGIKQIVMKHFGPIALGCITKIYHAIYSTGYIPKEFRKSRVVFIPKPQEAEYGEAGSFRPISLTQFLFKAMEQVVEWFLWEHAHNFGKISDIQHAYSGTKGTK